MQPQSSFAILLGEYEADQTQYEKERLISSTPSPSQDIGKEAKKPRTFRQRKAVWAILDKYAETHKQTTTEALEQILSDKKFLSPERQDASSGASDLLPCRQRVGTAPDIACLNPPTLYRKVKITEISAEICRACQILSKNLPDKYQVTPTPEQTLQATETPLQIQKANSDPANTHRKNAGMIWCPDGGFWKYPLMCDKCREQTYSRWYDCQLKKLRQKGEQQRVNTASNP